jgi:cobalt/nickel transport system permease protein
MNQLKRETSIGLTLLPWLVLFPQNASAMHIMEGFLPPVWALTWWILFIPFLALGIRKLKQIVSQDSHQKVLRYLK